MPHPISGRDNDHTDSSARSFAESKSIDERQTYLDVAVHAAFDPLARLTSGADTYSDELADYTKGFIKSLPLFMKGRLAVASLILSHAADEAKIGDSRAGQIADLSLGTAKGLVLKGTFRALSGQGLTPGMTGVGIGIASRISDTALSRVNYVDSSGSFSLPQGLSAAVSTGFNPKAVAVDAITFAASDVLWARIMNHSRGTAWYRPEITYAISGGAMGVTGEFGAELSRQLSQDGQISLSPLIRRSLLKGAFDAAAGGLGGAQTRHYSKLNPLMRDTPALKAAARSTPFQKAVVADSKQIALRDGPFIVEKKLPALTMETWVGWVHTPDGQKIRTVFRPDNGSEAFAHRMQSEIAAYGLQTLGFKMSVPVTVQRKVELAGKSFPGYIQEMEGVSLAAFAREKLTARPTQRQLDDLFQSNNSLKNSYANAWLHRMILGEWDNHALNMTVNQRNTRAPVVRNIDLGDSLRKAETSMDLIPTPGVRQGYDTINARLYKRLSGTKLDAETLAYLKDIESRFSTPQGRSKLFSVGMTPQQTDGMLGRIDWLIKNERMPAGNEALFYLPLNDARRAVERWFGKPYPETKVDQTHFFE